MEWVKFWDAGILARIALDAKCAKSVLGWGELVFDCVRELSGGEVSFQQGF